MNFNDKNFLKYLIKWKHKSVDQEGVYILQDQLINLYLKYSRKVGFGAKKIYFSYFKEDRSKKVLKYYKLSSLSFNLRHIHDYIFDAKNNRITTVGQLVLEGDNYFNFWNKEVWIKTNELDSFDLLRYQELFELMKEDHDLSVLLNFVINKSGRLNTKGYLVNNKHRISRKYFTYLDLRSLDILYRFNLRKKGFKNRCLDLLSWNIFSLESLLKLSEPEVVIIHNRVMRYSKKNKMFLSNHSDIIKQSDRILNFMNWSNFLDLIEFILEHKGEIRIILVGIFESKSLSFNSVAEYKKELSSLLNLTLIEDCKPLNDLVELPQKFSKVFTEINTKNELKKEGQQMHHCVGGYYSAVAQGHTRVFKLNSPRGTLSLGVSSEGKFYVGELRGFANKKFEDESVKQLVEDLVLYLNAKEIS